MKTELPDIIRLLLMSFNTVVIMYSLSKIAELRSSKKSPRRPVKSTRNQQKIVPKKAPEKISKRQQPTAKPPITSNTKVTKKPQQHIPKEREISFARSTKKPVHGSDAHDLTRIQGVGPKSEQILKRAGIKTYADLARRSPDSIKKILVEYDVRYGMYDVSSWPKQAKLANAGEWNHLKQLKKRLGPKI